jgi:hypothetical protein
MQHKRISLWLARVCAVTVTLYRTVVGSADHVGVLVEACRPARSQLFGKTPIVKKPAENKPIVWAPLSCTTR